MSGEAVCKAITGLINGGVQICPSGRKCVAFSNQEIQLFEIGDDLRLKWRQVFQQVTGCAFVNDEYLAVCANNGLQLVSVQDGSEIGPIEFSLRRNLRTKCTKLFRGSHDDRIVVKTTHPYLLTALDFRRQALRETAIGGEAIRSIAFHPAGDCFVGILDGMVQELVFGGFGEQAGYAREGIQLLPYIFAINVSACGKNIYVITGDESRAVFVVIDVKARSVVQRHIVTLSLSATLQEGYNASESVYYPCIIPLVGIDSAMIFRQSGELITLNVNSGYQETIGNPMCAPITSADCALNRGATVVIDYLGTLCLLRHAFGQHDGTPGWDLRETISNPGEVQERCLSV